MTDTWRGTLRQLIEGLVKDEPQVIDYGWKRVFVQWYSWDLLRALQLCFQFEFTIWHGIVLNPAEWGAPEDDPYWTPDFASPISAFLWWGKQLSELHPVSVEFFESPEMKELINAWRGHYKKHELV